MNSRILVSLFLASFVFSGFAQPKETNSVSTNQAAPRENPLAPVVDDPALPRVLLIGDSISMGYTVPVRNLLKGKANVHRIMENGGPTTNGLAKMRTWLGTSKWDVIHFNFGLHDLKFVEGGQQQVTPADYEKNLRELVRQLKETKAKLIWGNTTPIPGPPLKPERIAEDVLVYNAAAAKVMEENGIMTNDLYAFALARLSKIQQPQNVHFTREGSELLGGQVAATIEAALPPKK